MFQVAFVHNKKENHNINCKKKKKMYYAQFLEILVNSVCRLKNSYATITLTVYVHSSCCKRICRMWKSLPFRKLKANLNCATTFAQLDAATTLSRVLALAANLSYPIP